MSVEKIPVAAAQRISREFDQDQVIIVTWDKKDNRLHVVTYGKTIEDCRQVALGGNFVKRALGFPEEMCHAVGGLMPRDPATGDVIE